MKEGFFKDISDAVSEQKIENAKNGVPSGELEILEKRVSLEKQWDKVELELDALYKKADEAKRAGRFSEQRALNLEIKQREDLSENIGRNIADLQRESTFWTNNLKSRVAKILKKYPNILN